ncbi:hypothetical protein JZU46_06305 [bacterium]|nr:hypothetical protein [bacterium]
MLHPECRKDEIFLTNVTHVEYFALRWKTKRLGCIAYGGERIPGTGRVLLGHLNPVFVSIDEYNLKNKINIATIPKADAEA